MFIAITHYFEEEDKQSEAKCYISTPEALNYNQFRKRGPKSVYEALGDQGWEFVNGKTSFATIVDHGFVWNELFEFLVFTNDYKNETGVTVYWRDVRNSTWMKKVYADPKEAGFDDKESMQMNMFKMKDLTEGGAPLCNENKDTEEDERLCNADQGPIGLPTWYIEKDSSILGQYKKDKARLAPYGEHAQRIFTKAFAHTYFPYYAATTLYELDDYQAEGQ